MELYTSYWQVGLAGTTGKALIFSNKAPDIAVKLSRTGSGVNMVTASLADTDIESASLNAYTYTADLSGEASDTCIRCMISTGDSTIHVSGLSLLSLE